MTQKVVCKNSECSNEIQEATVERTGGYCMPCAQAKAKKEREEYIRKNRRDVNEFEGLQDVVEILKLVHEPRKYDPLINWIPHPTPTDELYVDLEKDEQARLVTYAEELIGTERHEEAEEICLCLSAFTDAALDRCLHRLVSQGMIWPSLAFRNAPAGLRDELLDRVESDAENRNHILLALAWIGDSTVVDHLARWQRNPPAWCDTLFIPPEEYSREAGWELTVDGERRDLFFHECYALKKGPSQSPESFRTVNGRSDKCPWCSCKLTNLFEIDLAVGSISSGESLNQPINVTTCEICTAFGIIFGGLDGKGSVSWSTKNVRPDYLPDDSESWGRLPQDSLSIAERRPPFYVADQFLPATFSQLGGHPTWVQDAVYPVCPECSETMKFLAQIDHQDIEDFSEGIYYSFVCFDCMTTATAYQQT